MKKIIALAVLLAAVTVSAKVIGTVNGYSILKKDADKFLTAATKKKVTDYSKLKEKDKKSVVERLAVDTLVLKTALKEIDKKKQEQIVAGFWLRQKAAAQKVTDKEVKKAYEDTKKFFVDKKGKTIPFDKVKALIKTSLKQKKAVAALMKKAKIVMGNKEAKKKK